MSGFNNLREMNLDPSTEVKLSYSDGIDVVHCHGTHVEDAVEQTDVVERVAEVITTTGIKIEGEYGGNPLDSLRDSMLLDEYPRDFSGFADFVADVMRENFYEVECFKVKYQVSTLQYTVYATPLSKRISKISFTNHTVKYVLMIKSRLTVQCAEIILKEYQSNYNSYE